MPKKSGAEQINTPMQQGPAASSTAITYHTNPLYNPRPAAQAEEDDILNKPSPWGGIRESTEQRILNSRTAREAADEQQQLVIDSSLERDRIEEFEDRESYEVLKNTERARLDNKADMKNTPRMFSSKIGRFRDGIKHAVTEAQGQKSAGYVAGNLVIADAAALTYYDNIAEKEINDGVASPNKENRQPSTVGIFKKAFSDQFNWSATKPAKVFEEKAKRDANQSKTSDNKNKTDILLIEQYYNLSKGLGNNEDDQEKDEEKIEQLYKFAKLRKYDISQRTAKELDKQQKLENDKRIIPILSREGLLNATRDAIGGKIIQIMSLGMRKGGSSSDARGIRGGIDFEIGEDEDGNLDFEEMAARKIKAGVLIPPSKTITQQLIDIEKKWNSRKSVAKQGNKKAAFFIHFSSLLEAFQGIMKIGSNVLNSISLYFKAIIAIAPPAGIVLGPLNIIIKGITTIMKVIDKIITGIRAIFDGLAMMLNDNPALFSLLRGETINSVAASASAGASYGLDEAGKQIKIGGTEQNKRYNIATAMVGSTRDSDGAERNIMGNIVKERVGQTNEEFALEQTASTGASVGSSLVTNVAIPEVTKYLNSSAAHAGEAHQSGFGLGKMGSGPKPTDGLYSSEINFENGEENLAKEAFMLANEKGMESKSKLSSKVNDQKFTAIESSEDASSANLSDSSEEVSSSNQENLNRSAGAWAIARNILIKSKREFNDINNS